MTHFVILPIMNLLRIVIKEVRDQINVPLLALLKFILVSKKVSTYMKTSFKKVLFTELQNSLSLENIHCL